MTHSIELQMLSKDAARKKNSDEQNKCNESFQFKNMVD